MFAVYLANWLERNDQVYLCSQRGATAHDLRKSATLQLDSRAVQGNTIIDLHGLKYCEMQAKHIVLNI